MTEAQVETRRGRPPMQTVKEPTKPGFKPASRLGGLKAPQGYTARWVDADEGNIARKLEEGWIMMDQKDNQKDFGVKDVNDTNSVDSKIKYRGMVAMMLPDDLRASRQEYYKAETARATQSIMKKADAESKNIGVQTYSPKGQSGRIVIE